MYEYAVIGKGMIGSAAARYLSQQSDAVVLIGPDEPQGDWTQHDGVFGSHYDQGRITRIMDRSIAWAVWAMRSIEAYPEIEAQSGIRFHYPCDVVCAGFTEEMPDGYISGYERTARQLGVYYEKYASEDFCRRHPDYFFEPGLDVTVEKDQAGYINPRQLVAAQVKITSDQGADIVREAVVEIDSDSVDTRAGVTLTTDGGKTIQAKKVLVAAGAWTEYLTGQKLGLIPTPRTVVMAELDAEEAERLRDMPVIMWYEGMNDPDIEGTYILPPIEYPDGKTYIKLGGALRRDQFFPKSDAELRQWFHGEGSPVEAEALERELRRVIPGLHTVSVQAKTCVITDQSDEYMPLIKPIVDGKVMVAAAGCGASAKSSNEIGRLAALQLKWM